MSRRTSEKISIEDMQQMIERDARESKSIYAPSGPPDPRLEDLYMNMSSAERTVRLVTSEQIKIDVTFQLNLEPLLDANTELLKSMEGVLLHDGHRRLASGKIGIDESKYHDEPAQLVFSCAASSRSRIRKFINKWKNTRQLA